MSLPINWQPSDRTGRREGFCPRCRPGRPMLLVVHHGDPPLPPVQDSLPTSQASQWIKRIRDAPDIGRVSQDRYELNIGYARGSDGVWRMQKRYRERYGRDRMRTKLPPMPPVSREDLANALGLEEPSSGWPASEPSRSTRKRRARPIGPLNFAADAEPSGRTGYHVPYPPGMGPETRRPGGPRDMATRPVASPGEFVLCPRCRTTVKLVAVDSAGGPRPHPER